MRSTGLFCEVKVGLLSEYLTKLDDYSVALGEHSAILTAGTVDGAVLRSKQRVKESSQPM